MRKILIGLLLCAVIVPSFGQMRGPDSCSAPDLYKADKRCYVRDYQKTQSPYNAVVRVADILGWRQCTGTIVQDGGYYYVYTAAHCVKSEKDNSVAEYIWIELQDGRYFLAKKNSVGDYDVVNLENNYGSQGDWAFYRIVNTPREVLDNGTNFVRGDARVKLSVYRSAKDFHDSNALGVGELDGLNQMFLPDDLKLNGKYPEKIFAAVYVGTDEAGDPVYYPFVYTFKKDMGDSGGYQLKKRSGVPFVYAANSIYVLGTDWMAKGTFNIDITKPYKQDRILNVRVVGYGMLKILSDSEISDFIDTYISWLKGKTAYRDDMTDGQKSSYGVKTFGGEVDGVRIDYDKNSYPMQFLSAFRQKYDSWFYDGDNLKVSMCDFFEDSGNFAFCQTWGGNSGGPVFDSRNVQIAIHSGGGYDITYRSWGFADGSDNMILPRSGLNWGTLQE